MLLLRGWADWDAPGHWTGHSLATMRFLFSSINADWSIGNGWSLPQRKPPFCFSDRGNLPSPRGHTLSRCEAYEVEEEPVCHNLAKGRQTGSEKGGTMKRVIQVLLCCLVSVNWKVALHWKENTGLHDPRHLLSLQVAVLMFSLSYGKASEQEAIRRMDVLHGK